MSVKISPKHGVNPTIPVCFFCGKDKNEVALLGQIGKEDKEAPMHMVLDYEPCEECQNEMSKGVALVVVTANSPDGRPPISSPEGSPLYPTGAWLVIKPDAFSQMTEQEWNYGDKSLIDEELYQHLTGGNDTCQ